MRYRTAKCYIWQLNKIIFKLFKIILKQYINLYPTLFENITVCDKDKNGFVSIKTVSLY